MDGGCTFFSHYFLLFISYETARRYGKEALSMMDRAGLSFTCFADFTRDLRAGTGVSNQMIDCFRMASVCRAKVIISPCLVGYAQEKGDQGDVFVVKNYSL